MAENILSGLEQTFSKLPALGGLLGQRKQKEKEFDANVAAKTATLDLNKQKFDFETNKQEYANQWNAFKETVDIASKMSPSESAKFLPSQYSLFDQNPLMKTMLENIVSSSILDPTVIKKNNALVKKLDEAMLSGDVGAKKTAFNAIQAGISGLPENQQAKYEGSVLVAKEFLQILDDVEKEKLLGFQDAELNKTNLVSFNDIQEQITTLSQSLGKSGKVSQIAKNQINRLIPHLRSLGGQIEGVDNTSINSFLVRVGAIKGKEKTLKVRVEEKEALSAAGTRGRLKEIQTSIRKANLSKEQKRKIQSLRDKLNLTQITIDEYELGVANITAAPTKINPLGLLKRP